MTDQVPIKRTRLSHEERVEKILLAFETMLQEYEISAISIAMVAEKAEMKRPLVYHFFPSIDAMADQLVERYCREIQARCVDELEGKARADLAATFGGFTRIQANYLNENPAAAKLLLGSTNRDASLHVRAQSAPKLAGVLGNIVDAQSGYAHGKDSSRPFPDIFQMLFELTSTIFSIRRNKDGRIQDDASDEAISVANAVIAKQLDQNC